MVLEGSLTDGSFLGQLTLRLAGGIWEFIAQSSKESKYSLAMGTALPLFITVLEVALRRDSVPTVSSS